MKKRFSFCLFIILCLLIVQAWAVTLDNLKRDYPPDSYITGIAEVESSGDVHNDKTRAEILARLEIAKQIRVRIQEESIDIMCEGEGKTAFAGTEECRNQLTTVIETTVDELLKDSQIVESGADKNNGVYYAVAVLPIKDKVFSLPEKIPSPSGRGKGEGGPTVEEVKVVTTEGKIVLGDDTTPAHARAP